MLASAAVAWARRPDGSDEFDLGNEIEAVARRDGHLDLVVDLLADQRAAERRVIGDLARLGVRFGLADNVQGPNVTASQEVIAKAIAG